VGTATNWQAVAAGYYHTVAVRSDGTLWAWGNSYYGQLGDDTTDNQSSPVQVGSATNWQAVAAGVWHTVALRSDGTLWAWGDNEFGLLGLGGQITPGKIGQPEILAQPVTQSVPAGAGVSFSVTVTGSRPLAYQWQVHGTNLTDHAGRSGSELATLTLFSALGSDAGQYQVLITNAYGSVTSAVASLTVEGPDPVVPQFAGYRWLGSGMELEFTGASQRVVEVHASTNLTDWTWLVTLTNETGQLLYLDPQATNYPLRFYRVRQLP
jgi:hypothetical protein